MGDNAIKAALKVTSTATLSKSALYYGIFWPAKRGGLPFVPIEYSYTAALILVNHSC